MATTRSAQLGPASRSVSVPDSVGEVNDRVEQGTVVLPMHVRWSGPTIRYDLSDRADRARVYEQILREGTRADVRRFIDPDELLRLWDDVVLPKNVRRAWATWFKIHRSVDVEC